jgi:hypothetical protein
MTSHLNINRNYTSILIKDYTEATKINHGDDSTSRLLLPAYYFISLQLPLPYINQQLSTCEDCHYQHSGEVNG